MDDPSIRDLTAYVLDLEDAIDRYSQDLEEAVRLNDEFTLSAAWGVVTSLTYCGALIGMFLADYTWLHQYDWFIRYPAMTAIFFGWLFYNSAKNTDQHDLERRKIDRIPSWHRYKASRPKWRDSWW